MQILENIKDKLKGENIRIVLPEGIEPRILGAAVRLKNESILEPILLGNRKEVLEVAKNNNFNIENIEIIDPLEYKELDMLTQEFFKRRNGKVTIEKAKELLKDVNYFGTMLTYTGKVHGMVSGSIHPTGDTVRPALQIIKTKPGVSKTSGAFVMVKDDKRYIFSDCAINITLTPDELAEIAVESAKTAKIFQIEPNIAMLSFSTKGSADSDEARLVSKATEIVKQIDSTLNIDGELQFDAAISERVGNQKAPGSTVAGKANVFIFPNLACGNIGYKIAQRLGGFEALGPILQGLNMPINDLSRGCNEDDVYKLSIITAAQYMWENDETNNK